MRNISGIEDLLLGNRLSNVIKRQESFFNNCKAEHYLDLQKTFSVISKITQIATTSSVSYILYRKCAYNEITPLVILPLLCKLAIYKTSNEVIEGINGYREELLKKLRRKKSKKNVRGEEWKRGTAYGFSDDLDF